MAKQRDLLWIAFLVGLGTVLYWNSLRTPFMWDEVVLITEDPRVHDWSHVSEIFTKPFNIDGMSAFITYYRPLSTLSFRIDYLFWKLNPLGYHLTNLVLHLGSTLLIFALYRHFFKNSQLAFWGAFLFLAHPAHVEAVTYIPSRTDVLSFFFFLASFCFYVEGREIPRRFWFYIGSVACYGLALLSKERATFLPLLVIAHALLIDREKTRWRGSEGLLLLGMVLCAIVWMLVRRYISIQLPLLAVLDIPRLALRLFVLPKTLFSYIQIWFFPWPLHMGRMIPIEILKVRTLLLEWSGLCIFLIGIFFFFRRAVERFWLAWIVVSMLPVIHIFPIYFHSPHLSLAISEYLLYFASAGLIGLLGSRFGSWFVVGERGSISGSRAVLFLGGVLTLFSFLVVWQNEAYRDRMTLFEQAVHYAPYHVIAYNQLGLAYLNDVGDPEKAEALFKKAVSVTPTDGHAYVNLGILAQQRGDLKAAENYYKKGLELMPGNSILLYNFGILYAIRKDWRGAIQFYEQAIKVNPYMFPMTHIERGRAYWELGQREKALQAAEEGLKIHPTDPDLQGLKRRIQERLASQKESQKFSPLSRK